MARSQSTVNIYYYYAQYLFPLCLQSHKIRGISYQQTQSMLATFM